MFFVFKQKTAYELRISDWSSDVCSSDLRVPTVVTGDVLYHHPHRRVLQEVMTCTRHRCTIDALGARRERYADRFLMPAAAMHRLYQRYPAAPARHLDLAHRCRLPSHVPNYTPPQQPTNAGTPPPHRTNTQKRK